MDKATADFEEKECWGYYTAIRLKNCNPKFIRSSDKIKNFIDKLCFHVKMKKFGNPQIVNFRNDGNVSGYSMTQLIETSLIAVNLLLLPTISKRILADLRTLNRQKCNC